MFQNARLKLTGWYLLIIMIISLAFSGVIYRASIFELNRFARAQQNKYENRTYVYSDGRVEVRPTSLQLDESLLDEARARILKSLLLINLGIMALAGVLGYYLSGLTLEPIAMMVDEQYRFVSDASHELKTPITAMKSTLEVALRDTKMTVGEARNVLKINLEEVASLQKLAEELLELSSNSTQVKLEKVDLKNVIAESVKMLAPLAIPKQIIIQAKVPTIIVMAENDSLKRAISTILDNAIKYGNSKSKIYINAKLQGKRVVIKIRDEGVGIDESEIEAIFDRFYRSDKARSTEGNGLGLAIAKKIIDSFKGEIDVTSKLGKGTIVTISLPYSARIQI